MDAEALKELVVKYFKYMGYEVEDNVQLEGHSGMIYNFDMLMSKGDDKRLVFVRDWKRTVGVNMILKLDKAAEDVGITDPVFVATQFSDHAKAYANRKKITIIPEQKLLLFFKKASEPT